MKKNRAHAVSRSSRVLALIISVAMVLAMMPAMVFADSASGAEPGGSKNTVNLVVFGNSTASGYGLPDFLNTNNGFATNNNYLEKWAADADGYTQDWTDEEAWTYKAAVEWDKSHPGLGRMSNYAFPWQLKKYIAGLDGVDKVNLTPVALNGMRTDELRAFLDEDYYNKVLKRESDYTDKWYAEHGGTRKDMAYGFLSAHMSWYLDNFRDSKATPDNTYKSAQKYVKDSIKDADVIVVDLCGNNFGTYLGYRLYAALGMNDRYFPNTYETLGDIDGIPADLMAKINQLRQTLSAKVDVLQSPLVNQILDTFIYSIADSIVNFSADMEMIHQLNPDAKVIAVGLNNPLKGIKINAGGVTVDFGAVAGSVYDLVNSYIKALDGNAGNYYYADVSGDIETFVSVIADAESLQALYADGTLEEGRGNYAINRIYNEFVYDFMGGEDGDAKTVYSIVQDGIRAGLAQKGMGETEQFKYVFDSWDALGDKNVSFRPVSYMTADQAAINSAASQEAIFAAFGASAEKPDADHSLTKGVVKVVAAKYGMLNLSNDQKTQLQQAAIAQGCTTEQQVTEFIYNFCFNQVTDADIANAYAMIQNGYKQNAQNAGGFSELSDTECATFNPAGQTLYVTFNPAATSLTGMFGVYQGEENPVFLTKALISQATAASVKPAVQQMLYEALRNHNTLDMAGAQAALGDMDEATAAIKDYMFKVMTGDQTAQLDEVYWGLISLEAKVLLSNGVGIHPDATGCTQKFEAIKKAYESDRTALEQTKEEIAADLAAVVEMLRNTGARDDIDAIIAKLEKIQKALPVLEKAAGYAEIAMEYEKQFEDVMNQTLDLLGITTDDLMKQAQFVMKSLEGADIQKLAENIRILAGFLEKMPETTEKVKAELSRLEAKVDTIRKMLEEAGIIKSNDLLARLKDLAAKLEAAQTKEDYMLILTELSPIGEELLKLAAAVANLPEYEAALNEYMYVSKTSISNLEGRMGTAEKQLAMLSAMSVDSDFSTKVAFKSGKATITLTIENDDLADGYTLKLNGKDVKYSVKGGKLVYTVSNAKIGSKYKFSLTPYVVFDDGTDAVKMDGNTTTKTVTPKVSLKKASVKSAKGGRKSVTVKWAKVKNSDGYKISCKVGSKTKTVTVRGGSKVSKKISGLTSGKKCSVKVRAYKKVNGKTYYGKWSSAKKATVK